VSCETDCKKQKHTQTEGKWKRKPRFADFTLRWTFFVFRHCLESGENWGAEI